MSIGEDYQSWAYVLLQDIRVGDIVSDGTVPFEGSPVVRVDFTFGGVHVRPLGASYTRFVPKPSGFYMRREE